AVAALSGAAATVFHIPVDLCFATVLVLAITVCPSGVALKHTCTRDALRLSMRKTGWASYVAGTAMKRIGRQILLASVLFRSIAVFLAGFPADGAAGPAGA